MCIKSMGEIRPNSQPLANANGEIVGVIYWVAEDAAIKRIRRYLTKLGHCLVITRAGTQARESLGEFAILDERHRVLDKDIKISDWMRSHDLLAAEEMISLKEKGWKYHIARSREAEVNGVICQFLDPVTRKYKTEKAAHKASESISDRSGLSLVGSACHE